MPKAPWAAVVVYLGQAAAAAAEYPLMADAGHANFTRLSEGGICDSIPLLDCSGQDLPDGVLHHMFGTHLHCCNACQQHPGCGAWTWNWRVGDCFLKSGCDHQQTGDVDLHSGHGPSHSPPSPPSPAPPSPPHPSPGGRKGSFLVIGDWGHDPSVHGNLRTDRLQRDVAERMLQKFRELGDVKFILNLGDSFYPSGITSKSDGKWQSIWRDIYAPELRSVPWYSVYGNHDIYADWGCACGNADGSQCNQLNSDINDKDFFYMPGVNWFKTHPELGIEVVALDFNEVSEHTCSYELAAKCENACMENLRSRADAAMDLLNDRRTKSSQPNLVVFSHYPTDYFHGARAEVLDALRDGSKQITYFGGHRHVTDHSGTSIAPNTNWVVGGCGGWSCDGSDQGFVVAEIGDVVTTYADLSDQHLCNQFMNATVGTEDKASIYV
eukprot:TRINITY_DN31448_c0_g1_i1.p1 TRINITY_DN31448_c0_g1~~TRINITY_DN31448_c0_g1_i1.p1  ORF type:complete len:438 (+),score=55.13 TRINITY_DN31448_c0_g1_i1:50-1363(+)